MSKTFTKKVHRGEIQKAENAKKKAAEEAARKEQEEAAKWVAGSKQITKHDLKLEKQQKYQDHKELLKKLYEEEQEELLKGSKRKYN